MSQSIQWAICAIQHARIVCICHSYVDLQQPNLLNTPVNFFTIQTPKQQQIQSQCD